SHSFEVRATDAVGHVDATPAAFSWTIDTTAPDTSIDSGPSGSTEATGATFEFSATEAGSTFQCRLDGGSFAACTSPQALSGLSVGLHTFEVRATDGAGNTDASPAGRTWTVAAPASST